jgi:hypothetical protein
LPCSQKMPIFKALKWSLAFGDLYLNNAIRIRHRVGMTSTA